MVHTQYYVCHILHIIRHEKYYFPVWGIREYFKGLDFFFFGISILASTWPQTLYACWNGLVLLFLSLPLL